MSPEPRRCIAAICVIGLAIGASGSLPDAINPFQSSQHPSAAKTDLTPPQLPITAPQPGGGRIDFIPTAVAVKSWATAREEMTLVKDPSGEAREAAVLPSGSYVKVLRMQADWVEVAYGGEHDVGAPTIGWGKRASLEPMSGSPRWVKAYEETKVWPSADATTPKVASLPRWSWIELTGAEQAGRFAVRYPGDGRRVAPGTGWVDASAIVPVHAPDAAEIPWGYPATTAADAVRIDVPYRTQLDDTPWASANCGPTALTMGLEYLGKSLSSGQVRRVALDAQGIRGNDVGTYIWALAAAADRLEARALDLYEDRGQHRWSTDDVRRHVENGEPVILQVAYRALPGRENALYGGDHYIIVTGLVDDGFLYNDPVDSDGIGYDRVMTAAQLDQAMNATDRRYVHAGFALAPA